MLCSIYDIVDLKREQWKCDACSKIKYTEMVCVMDVKHGFTGMKKSCSCACLYFSLYNIVAEVFVFMFIGLV